MKIDPKKHKYPWRIQKGSHVDGTVGRTKIRGVVKQVLPSKEAFDSGDREMIVECDDGQTRTIPVSNLRLLKTANTIKKEQRGN
jgi:hypothetical protein